MVIEARLGCLGELQVGIEVGTAKLISKEWHCLAKFPVPELFVPIDHLNAMFVLFLCRRIANRSEVAIHCSWSCWITGDGRPSTLRTRRRVAICLSRHDGQ